jgi:hypothetical protein
VFRDGGPGGWAGSAPRCLTSGDKQLPTLDGIKCNDLPSPWAD